MSIVDELDSRYYTKGSTFNRDEISALISSGTSGYLGNALTTDSPGSVTAGKYYSFKDAGTYTNFKDASNNSIVIPAPATGKAIFNGLLYYTGNGWIFSYSLVDVNTSANVTQTWVSGAYAAGKQFLYNGQLYEATSPTASTDVPGISSKWNPVIDKYSKAALDPTINNVNQAFTTGSTQVPLTPVVSTGNNNVSSYGATNTYGWGFPVGVIQNFSKIEISILSPVTFTSWRLVVKEVNSSGTVLYDNTFTGTFGDVNVKATLTANITAIANASGKRLWLEVYANQYFSIYRTGTAALIFTSGDGYPPISFATTNNMGATGLGTTSTNMDIYARFTSYVPGIEATDRLKTMISTVASALPLPAAVDKSVKVSQSLFATNFIKVTDKVTFTDNIGPLTGFYGIGFPVGVVQNFDSASFYAYRNTGVSTKFMCIIRKNNKDGDIIAQKEIALTLTTDKTLVSFKFDTLVPNAAGDRLYMTVFSDGVFGYYKRYPAATSLFTAEAGYPPFYGNSASNAYTTLTLTGSGAQTDVWTQFTQYADVPYLTETGKAILGATSNVGGLPATNRRVAFAGSSVTWGDGFLQSGFVADTIRRMQAGIATSIMPVDVSVSGESSKVFTSDRKLFNGLGLRIEGTNAEIAFNISGNELSITQLIERSNAAASVFEVFADNTKIGEFDNYNTAPIGSETKSFTGNGTDTKFDLGRAFTYNHTLTVAGVTKVIELNTTVGAGYTFPASTDAVVIRKYSADAGGKPEVHHWVWFKTVPAAGAAIVITQNYAEEICYEKTTIGKNAAGVLESSYGDGNLSYDTTNPASLSSGLDFRQTDTRAVKHFRFADDKKRSIRIRIKGNYTGATGTPYLYFNFATNRYFHFQNAGIGGYEIFSLAREIDTTYNLSWQRITQFKPDALIIDVAPNEDWQVKGHKLYTSYNGTALADLRRTVLMPVRDITYNSSNDNYSWSRWIGKITAIDETSVTVLRDTTHVVNAAPVQGDVLLIGTYFSDNRECVERIVDSYDATTGKITFLNPISKGEHLYDDISAFVGQEVRVRSLTYFTDRLATLMNKLTGVAPELKVAIMTNPLPNIHTRELWGYRLVLEKFAKALGYVTLAGRSIQQFQVTQARDLTYTIDASTLLTDPITGYKYATLPVAAGSHSIFPVIMYNGVDIHGKNAFLENGFAYRPDTSKSGTALNTTSSLPVNNNLMYNTTPPRLIITSNAPTSGSITVMYTSNLWSGDSCHVNNNTKTLYGDVYTNDYLTKA